ncbi:nucleotide exchange factor GrpE [sulfur-oxidizing endosymbiont of Gigantopelta aegis]|uniref:nucleotide exchange factor GrpE n=1 Tax=sulfur-oxidizing endosymbiont of Gigantopelta aegis TaxID=2794934 RepID=UPI0018DD215A|nr:nucleotide exchange factor GrpE [sulfur-oxidizing endosymbiont of Gigantopelta aegis]
MVDEQKVDEQVEDDTAQASGSSSEEAVSNDEAMDDSTDSNEEVSDELAALEAEELIVRIKQAQAKADENWDVALRTKAEMENVRRRTEKEVSNARKFGIEKMINEILPVKDSMELGLKAAIETDIEDEAVHKIREGMELTLKMMNDALKKIGISEIAPEEGEVYSAEFHQAMSMQEIPGKEANTIVAVMQKGYLLNERMIRPAMVMVAK